MEKSKMTKAEEAAMKAYPNVEQPVWDKSYPKTLFVRHTERNAFIRGYEQAEKDFALSWEDIAKIDALILDVNNEMAVDYSLEISRQKFYEEVLRRYSETKK